MVDIQRKLAEHEELLDIKKKDLLKLQNEVHVFIGTDHKAKAANKYQEEIRKTAIGINTFVISLIETKAASDSFKEEAEKLCTRGMELNTLVRDIAQELADDFTQRQHSEAVDVIKITGVVAGLAIAAMTISNKTIDPDSSHAALEATAGATLGLTISFHKQILLSLRRAAIIVCTAPKKHRVRERLIAHGKQLLAPLMNERSLVFVIDPPERRNERKKGLDTLSQPRA